MSNQPRRRMPAERSSITHRFQIGSLKGYITAGFMEDGSLGEIFIRANKQGSLERGLLHTVAVLISVMLQHNVPLSQITDKLSSMAFEPSGVTTNPKIPIVNSVMDYLARWLEDLAKRLENHLCLPTTRKPL